MTTVALALPDVNTYITTVQQQLNPIFQSHYNLFYSLGINLFRGFATILIVWTGVKAALSAASGHEGFDFGQFASLILTIAFGYAMIRYYASEPIPGFGVTFHDLIWNQGISLADKIGRAEFDRMNGTLNQITIEVSKTRQSMFDPTPIIAFVVIWLGIMILKLIAFLVIAFGYIAGAVLGIIGPVFIPFFIVPKLDFLFWGWFKSFLQYSFYSVIANLFILVITDVLMRMLVLFTQGQNLSDKSTLVAEAPLLVVLLVAGAFGIGKIPTLVSHLFSGSSSGGPDLVGGAIAGAKTVGTAIAAL